MFRPFILALLPLVLATCNVGPKYSKPDAKLPAEFKTSGVWKLAKPADQQARGTWWRLFGDSRLNDLMREAEAANASLEIAKHNVEEAKALARADSAALFPTLDLNTSAKRNRNSGNISYSSSGGRSVTHLHASLDASYEPDFWGKVRNSITASEANAEAVEANYRSALLSLQGELALNYFALQAQDETIALLKRTTATRQKGVDLAKARFKQGDTAQLDVAQAETELASTQSEAIGLETKRHALEHAIALLLGKTPSQFSLPEMELPDRAPSVPHSVPADLLQRRPDIAAAEREMASLNAEIGVARAALFPSVKLGLTGGTESSFIEKIANIASRIWGLGPELDLPLFDGGKRHANIDAAKARYDGATAKYRDTVLKAVRDVEDALSAIEVRQRQRTFQEQTVAAARRTVELAQKRYDAGLVAYYEVLDAQRTQLHAEQEATVISAELFTNHVLLIKALGGGW
jgi:NodT family efflux transporter outer membrane factor (OMF) lipoprotein